LSAANGRKRGQRPELLKIAPGSHRPRSRTGEECRPQPRVVPAEPLGNEHFHRLTHQLRPRVAENPLGLSIDHDDRARPIDHYHGVRCGLDHQPEAPLGHSLLRRRALIVTRAAVR